MSNVRLAVVNAKFLDTSGNIWKLPFKQCYWTRILGLPFLTFVVLLAKFELISTCATFTIISWLHPHWKEQRHVRRTRLRCSDFSSREVVHYSNSNSALFDHVYHKKINGFWSMKRIRWAFSIYYNDKCYLVKRVKLIIFWHMASLTPLVNLVALSGFALRDIHFKDLISFKLRYFTLTSLWHYFDTLWLTGRDTLDGG